MTFSPVIIAHNHLYIKEIKVDMSPWRISKEKSKSVMVSIAMWSCITSILFLLLIILLIFIGSKYGWSDSTLETIAIIHFPIISLSLMVGLCMSFAGVISPYCRLKSFFVLVLSLLSMMADIFIFFLACNL